MNIGIFGGTFNPPHLGHLIVAESVRDQLRFDKILFVPSATPPNKSERFVAPASDRVEMIRLSTEGNREFEVSDIETRRGGISYTIDTIDMLVEMYPQASLALIIGVDNLMEFQSWKSPDEIVAKAELVAMTRPGYSLTQVQSKYARLAKPVSVPQIGISGTEIRRRVRLGRSIRYLVPRDVEEYIARTGLYKE